jgi:putative addiction module CopG family antidote
MTEARQFEVALPSDVAEAVEEKVRSGAYSSVSDVISESLRAFVARDNAVETWLREEVVAGHAEFMADPSMGVAAGDILTRIRGRRSRVKVR